MRCPAPPHDLLKVIAWPRHHTVSLIPEDVREKCEELKWIKEHRGWPSDKLSAMLARPKCEYSYWPIDSKRWGSKDPFLIKVFGDIKHWPEDERERLFNEVIELYRRKEDTADTHAEANELLADYPQDSRFPIVGLKVHHYLTWALHERLYDDRTGREKEPIPPGEEAGRIYLMRFIIPPLALAHRLRSLREYMTMRRRTLKTLHEVLKNYRPILMGDELLLVLVDIHEIDEILSQVAGKEVDVDMEIYTYEVRRWNGEYYAEEVEVKRLSSGKAMELGVSPGSAMWSKHLNQDYVAWIFVRPENDLLKSALEFVRYAEGVLDKYFSDRREKKGGPTSKISVSPDILVAVMEGYGDFLSALQRRLRIRRDNIIFVSFDQSLFIYGLEKPEHAIRLYLHADDVRADLHISTAITIVITQPKHPFWHVLRLIGDREKFDGVVFALGGKIVCLRSEDIRLLRRVIGALEDVSKRAFYRIVGMSRRMEPAVLKFMLEGMVREKKIPSYAANRICWLIDRLCERYGHEARKVITQALRALVPFVGGEESEWMGLSL